MVPQNQETFQTKHQSAAVVKKITYQEVRLKYPKEKFLIAIAEMKSSQEEARSAVKSDISSQIRSSIKSSSQTIIQHYVQDTKSSSKHDQVKNTIENTEFEHAEMIKVDEGLSGRDDSGFYAVAYLQTDEVVPVFIMEYEKSASLFRPLAHGALKEKGISVFANHYKKISEENAKMARIALQIQALSGKPFQDFLKDMDLFNKVTAKKAAIISQLQICLTIKSNMDSSSELKISQIVTDAISLTGVPVAQGKRCSGTVSLAVNSQTECKEGRLGPVCLMSIEGSLTDQLTGEKLTDFSYPNSFKGVHGSDTEKAKKNLIDNLTKDKIVKLVAEPVKSVLPAE